MPTGSPEGAFRRTVRLRRRVTERRPAVLGWARMTTDDDAVSILVTEQSTVPPLSIAFGALPVIPFVAGAILAWTAGPWSPLFIDLTVLWGALILTFLAGVRRGLSFRTMGGPTTAQIATMLWLFALGASSLVIVALSIGTAVMPPAAIAAVLLAMGFASLVVIDPRAAERGEVPLHFRRLRIVQLPIPAAALVAVAAAAL